MQEQVKHQKIDRPSTANSTTRFVCLLNYLHKVFLYSLFYLSFQRATVDIFNMQDAPEEHRYSIPHSHEQLDSRRKQKNLFTWENTEAENSLPSRKIGVGAYSGFVSFISFCSLN